MPQLQTAYFERPCYVPVLTVPVVPVPWSSYQICPMHNQFSYMHDDIYAASLNTPIYLDVCQNLKMPHLLHNGPSILHSGSRFSDATPSSSLSYFTKNAVQSKLKQRRGKKGKTLGLFS